MQKTRETNASVKDFIASVNNPRRRRDAEVVVEMMRKASGKRPKMWGPSIIGFGKHRYTLANGKDSEICRIGFAPRSQALVFYLTNFDGRDEMLRQLGKHKMGKGCLYINKLADVELDVLQALFEQAWRRRSINDAP